MTLFPIFAMHYFPLASAEDTLRISGRSLAGDSTPIRDAQVGDKLVVTATVENRGKDVTTVVIVEVRDREGMTVQIGCQTATIKEGEAMGIGVGWIPEKAGDYEFRVFAISGLDTPAILTPVSTSKVSITSLPGSRSLAVGDKTFEVIYQFSSEGTLRSLRVYVPDLAIVAKVKVAQDANLTLVLPRKMLEQLEKVSKGRYCVGSELVVFVDGIEVAPSYKELETGEILTVALNQGASKVEIVGTFPLGTPATC